MTPPCQISNQQPVEKPGTAANSYRLNTSPIIFPHTATLDYNIVVKLEHTNMN